jgi:hypothetical protein
LMFVCCECCVLSGRGLCDSLITRPEESYRIWCIVVYDHETFKTRRLKPATGLWKIQTQWVVTPGKQTNNNYNYYSPVDLSHGSRQTVDGNTKMHTDLQMLTFIPSIHVLKLCTVNSVCILVPPRMICTHMLPLERWTGECSLFL